MDEQSRTGPASLVVQARLAELVDEVARQDAACRRGEAEGVHQLRVTCRRLRSLLATARPLLDRTVTEPVRDEVRWLARSLSDRRDAHVVGELLTGLVDDEDPELVDGPVRERLRTSYAVPGGPPEALGTDRYLALCETLGRLVVDPPWSARAERPAADELRRRVRRDVVRLGERWAAVADADDRNEALHDARKAAKRVRYAAEAWESVGGKDATRLRKAARRLTSTLGERQDTVVARKHLVELAATAAAAGEPTFTYGRLHARLEARAERIDGGLDAAWRRFTAPATRSTC